MLLPQERVSCLVLWLQGALGVLGEDGGYGMQRTLAPGI